MRVSSFNGLYSAPRPFLLTLTTVNVDTINLKVRLVGRTSVSINLKVRLVGGTSVSINLEVRLVGRTSVSINLKVRLVGRTSVSINLVCTYDIILIHDNN